MESTNQVIFKAEDAKKAADQYCNEIKGQPCEQVRNDSRYKAAVEKIKRAANWGRYCVLCTFSDIPFIDQIQGDAIMQALIEDGYSVTKLSQCDETRLAIRWDHI